MSLPAYDGFSCGYTGSIGGTLSSFQRVARHFGRPEPTSTTGRKGQGRAKALASFTLTVTRKRDGEEKTLTVGPGYHSRKDWERQRLDGFRRLVGDFARG